MEKSIKVHAQNIRKRIAKYGYESGRGHVSSALSCTDILSVLYCSDVLDVRKISEQKADRDKVILSKGHAGLALYASLIECGLVDEKVLNGFCEINGTLATHPEIGVLPGVEATGGSLGQGIGFACGIALANKIEGNNSTVYVIVGDGEMQEGSVWEALLFADTFKLYNLKIIIDNNGWQISNKTNEIIKINPLIKKLNGFSFVVNEINGHDCEAIYESLTQKNDKCHVIVANTIKGKGISFIENKSGWHGHGLNKEENEEALLEISNG